MTKLRKEKLIAAGIMLPLLAGCGMPKPAVTVARLTVNQTAILKADFENYAASANMARANAAQRLAAMQAQNARLRQRNGQIERNWRIVGDKTAFSTIKELRTDDPKDGDDLTAIGGFQDRNARALKDEFGKMELDTKALAEVIEKTNKVAKPDRSARIQFLIGLAKDFFKESKLAKGSVAGLFGEVDKLASDIPSSLPKSAEEE